ncbi:hypothetical protein A3A93_05915 [Candidatus Roizmanbacteria bacterium RIFCSPLOWO2_01_FULL_38_12]|uniref:Penicillin-binding protein 2 n=1 Tax=Candidatus Roizmanbacteria bacterium RIFCSPLOWO2_01_FULL_38_12 TaxID=1802061 RepID=A0A1F7IVC1_9BACT|nr:MAG: hypothetical protein A2861_02915 [Candidatus Roizmanbacteria bacterium RIFCSPHIGHO2_01_FULL_38_15]OGK36255.1 MAG: hypothetical protein A3F59_00055 [Candidatus Roizmanbacteria bacterium RIFCSPHIGHO2_12_FULL_38_13]OGK47295.1 MAG: hypothetical protein A3A93_05915 [Candidatus Roizmanbacteria bacterium RIFCSPLOWO2_01_FULL_38_12]
MNNLPFIEKGRAGSINFQKKQVHGLGFVYWVYIISVFVFFLIAIARLFQITVVKGAYYGVLAEHNRVREVVIEPLRGTIKDRKGVTLAANHKPEDEAQSLKRVVSERIYYNAVSVSHLLGYVQTADQSDINKDRCLYGLILGDKTGKSGVEKTFECELRGEHGKKLIEVDASDNYKQTIDILPPQSGAELQLAVDIFLQEKAYDLMQNRKGAVVGIKPGTGEVLVLVSNPGFDPQVFEDGDVKIAENYFKDPEKPLYNRATEGVYPPGSVFKPFVAVAGLEEKAVTTKTLFEDKGFLEAGPLKFHNWYFLEYGRTEGDVDIYKALQRSNDIYFYQLGAKLGPEKIKRWAELFGFQNRTGIGVAEKEGIIPTAFWKEDTLGENWYLGDTYNLSIGQGYVSVTPLQVAMATSVFANGGQRCTPMLLKSGSSPKQIPHCEKVPMSQNTYNVIREGMKRACETGGTGYPFFDFAVQEATISAQLAKLDKDSSESAKLTRFPKKTVKVGCKTGTAESHAISGKPHAWFTVFAPFENPEIVLTVLIEEGGQGSDEAAPVAKEILSAYFERME